MKKIFCISSVDSVGCTFFDWSIHFLSGQEQFYHWRTGWNTLTDNPLTKQNAHLHKKNHPNGFVSSKDCFTQLLNSNDPGLYSAYPVLLHLDKATESINIDIKDIENPASWSALIDYINTDYANIFDYCAEHKIDFIYVDNDTDYPLYFLSARTLEKKMFTDTPVCHTQELDDEIQQVFFKSSVAQWESLGLTNRWDIRERLALDSRPFDRPPKPKLDLSKRHLWINSSDLWFRGTTTIKKILNYLNLEIDHTRWDHWVTVYRKWQEIQVNKLEFDMHFDHIIECIVNNWYYNLGELSLLQESVIQHALIYRHNLNLKTWKLEKFPLNTQDLHKLLESNIHPI